MIPGSIISGDRVLSREQMFKHAGQAFERLRLIGRGIRRRGGDRCASSLFYTRIYLLTFPAHSG